MSSPANKSTTDFGIPAVEEVRYRLSDLLAELKVERSAGLFAQERFSQKEIEKIFKAHKKRHGKRLP